MSHIDLVTPEKAAGPIAEAYAQVSRVYGMVPPPMQLWAVSPNTFAIFGQAIAYYNTHPTMSQHLRRWTAFLVAREDDCRFCIDMNGGMLIELGVTPEELEAGVRNPDSIALPPKEKALLLLALKAVSAPKTVTPEEIQTAVALGNTERDILDAVTLATLIRMDDTLLNAFAV